MEKEITWHMHSWISRQCFCFILIFAMPSSRSAKETYYLAFLSPFPDPSGEHLIPVQLAQQWQSAFQVAMEVLNAEDRPYQLVSVPADTGCTWMKVLTIAEAIGNKEVIGIVGPACSGAALSAVNYLDKGIPIVSFAATHELLSNRESYTNFFRTVYGDSHQAVAVLSAMEKWNMWNVTLLCTKDYYSLSLASSIQQAAIKRVSSMKIVEEGENTSVDASQLVDILSALQPDDFVILAVLPLVAKDIWTIASKVGKTAYPWWYFGTDGVTAFDPSIDDSSLGLVGALQGEIGLSPNGGGDYIMSSQCQKFFDYWREKAYPGMPLPGNKKTRSYVTHLIDTVTLYFEIVDALLNTSLPVNATNVLSALKGSGIGSPKFTGCTGLVEIDPNTGSRKISSDNPATYDFVSLVENSWELKGQINNGLFVSLQTLSRPDSEVLEAKKKIKVGRTAGVVLSLLAFVTVAGILIVFYKRRQSRPGKFMRLHKGPSSSSYQFMGICPAE